MLLKNFLNQFFRETSELTLYASIFNGSDKIISSIGTIQPLTNKLENLVKNRFKGWLKVIRENFKGDKPGILSIEAGGDNFSSRIRIILAPIFTSHWLCVITSFFTPIKAIIMYILLACIRLYNDDNEVDLPFPYIPEEILPDFNVKERGTITLLIPNMEESYTQLKEEKIHSIKRRKIELKNEYLKTMDDFSASMWSSLQAQDRSLGKNINIIGSEFSGKYEFSKYDANGTFSSGYENTIGVDYTTRTISVPLIGRLDIRLQTLNTTKRFESIIGEYIKGSNQGNMGNVIIFNPYNQKEFENLETFYKILESTTFLETHPIVLVANHNIQQNSEYFENYIEPPPPEPESEIITTGTTSEGVKRSSKASEAPSIDSLKPVIGRSSSKKKRYMKDYERIKFEAWAAGHEIFYSDIFNYSRTPEAFSILAFFHIKLLLGKDWEEPSAKLNDFLACKNFSMEIIHRATKTYESNRKKEEYNDLTPVFTYTSTNIQVPAEILTSRKRKTLLPFIGAGFSIGAGLPDWRGLLESISSNIGDLNLKEEIKKETNNEIAALKIKEYLDDEEELCKHIDYIISPKIFKPQENHKILIDLIPNISGIITTNFDNLLEKSLIDCKIPHKIIYREYGDLRKQISEAKDTFLLKLHGDPSHPLSLVFHFEQYKRLTEDQSYLNALEYIFSNYCILFIGYSVSDQYIINLLSLLNNVLPSISDLDAFILVSDPTKGDIARLNDSNITAIPYSTNSKNDHSAVNVFLKKLLKDQGTPTPKPYFTGRNKEIEHIIKALSKKIGLIQIIGPGGIGKSELAKSVISNLILRAKSEKIQIKSSFWIDLIGKTTLSALITEIIQILDLNIKHYEYDDLKNLILKVSDKMITEKALLFIDNSEELIRNDKRFISIFKDLARKLTNSSTSVILTSRIGINLNKTSEKVELSKLKDVDLLEIFQSLTNFNVYNLKKQNEEFLYKLINLLEGNPTSAVLCAGISKREEDFKDLYYDLKTQRLKFEIKEKMSRTYLLQQSISLSLSKIPGPLLRSLRKLSLFPGGLYIKQAAEILGMTSEDMPYLLSPAVNSNIIVKSLRYRILQPIREVIFKDIEILTKYLIPAVHYLERMVSKAIKSYINYEPYEIFDYSVDRTDQINLKPTITKLGKLSEHFENIKLKTYRWIRIKYFRDENLCIIPVEGTTEEIYSKYSKRIDYVEELSWNVPQLDNLSNLIDEFDNMGYILNLINNDPYLNKSFSKKLQSLIEEFNKYFGRILNIQPHINNFPEIKKIILRSSKTQKELFGNLKDIKYNIQRQIFPDHSDLFTILKGYISPHHDLRDISKKIIHKLSLIEKRNYLQYSFPKEYNFLKKILKISKYRSFWDICFNDIKEVNVLNDLIENFLENLSYPGPISVEIILNVINRYMNSIGDFQKISSILLKDSFLNISMYMPFMIGFVKNLILSFLVINFTKEVNEDCIKWATSYLLESYKRSQINSYFPNLIYAIKTFYSLVREYPNFNNPSCNEMFRICFLELGLESFFTPGYPRPTLEVINMHIIRKNPYIVSLVNFWKIPLKNYISSLELEKKLDMEKNISSEKMKDISKNENDSNDKVTIENKLTDEIIKDLSYKSLIISVLSLEHPEIFEENFELFSDSLKFINKWEDYCPYKPSFFKMLSIILSKDLAIFNKANKTPDKENEYWTAILNLSLNFIDYFCKIQSTIVRFYEQQNQKDTSLPLIKQLPPNFLNNLKTHLESNQIVQSTADPKDKQEDTKKKQSTSSKDKERPPSFEKPPIDQKYLRLNFDNPPEINCFILEYNIIWKFLWFITGKLTENTKQLLFQAVPENNKIESVKALWKITKKDRDSLKTEYPNETEIGHIKWLITKGFFNWNEYFLSKKKEKT